MSNNKGTTVFSLAKYTPEAKGLVVSAQRLADKDKQDIEPVHLLICAINKTQMPEILLELKINHKVFLSAAEKSAAELPKKTNKGNFSALFLDMLNRAEKDSGDEKIGTKHLINALSQELRSAVGNINKQFKIQPGAFKDHLSLIQEKSSVLFTKEFDHIGDGTPIINIQDTQLQRLLQVIRRYKKPNALILGEGGVGKTTLIRALANKVIEDDDIDFRLLELNTEALFAGTASRGDVEDRISKLINDLSSAPTIFIVEDIDNLLGQSLFGINMSDLFKPIFFNKNIKTVATVLAKNLSKAQEKGASVLRNFITLTINPPTIEQTIEILRGIARTYEVYHGVEITEKAIDSAAKFAKRYMKGKDLPDSAIDLIDETLSRRGFGSNCLLELNDMYNRIDSIKKQEEFLLKDNDAGAALEKLRLERKTVEDKIDVLKLSDLNSSDSAVKITDADVADTVSVLTKIPVNKIVETEMERLIHMEKHIGKFVIGQDEAVKAVSDVIRRSRIGLRDPKKPIGSFLFCGPSGVGKTELAKVLANHLFNDEAALVRLDMSEFMERHMAQRLLGSPPGYVDSDKGGFLTEAVHKNPYSILLFDEMEKAHNDVFNLLLQLLDDGRLTDGRGMTVDFSNTIVIMTSNIGARDIVDLDPELSYKEKHEKVKDILFDKLKKQFRPEFLNRIGDTVVFSSLTHEHLKKIVDLQIDKLNKLLDNRQIKVQLTEGARDLLAELSYEPIFGARPMQRVILKKIQNPLSEFLLKNLYGSSETIVVDVNDDRKIIFKK